MILKISREVFRLKYIFFHDWSIWIISMNLKSYVVGDINMLNFLCKNLKMMCTRTRCYQDYHITIIYAFLYVEYPPNTLTMNL